MYLLKAHEMQEGAGVEVRRLFPFQRDRLVADPFVLWDDFSIGAGAGFPTHAHRGFEAITYLFDGTMNHADNLGNDSTVTAGGAQRFTAGKGIQHSEMPGENGKTTGIQLWINLPQSMKQIEPEYQQVDVGDIPQYEIDGVTVREIVGEQSPLQLKTPVSYLDLSMPEDTSYNVEIPKDMQGVIYLHEGELEVGDQSLQPGDSLRVDDMDSPVLKASKASRVMIALGKPHNESVRLYGGFVD